MSDSAFRIPHSEMALPASLEAETAAFLAACDEAHVTVMPAPTPWFAELRNIIVRGKRYADKVAACPCTDLRLFLYAGCGYTVCARHGLLEIGHVASADLRANGRKGGVK